MPSDDRESGLVGRNLLDANAFGIEALGADLFDETRRQLTVCNACRYCEGYCPVWPALELRREPSDLDITHLADLCHDCRECFTACMYTAPHEFALDPPRVFSAVRARTYAEYIRPAPVFPRLRGWVRRGAELAVTVLLLIVLTLLTTGGRAFTTGSHGSAYDLISHWALIIVVAAPAVWSVAVLSVAALRYWRDLNGDYRGLAELRAWGRTLSRAARLTHHDGGGEGCAYPDTEPDAEPSSLRRRLHHLVMYGFLLTFVSTCAAAVQENLFGLMPPYGYLSVPVLTGMIGGLLATAGCAGFLVLDRRAPEHSTPRMRHADRSFLWALVALMVSGMLTTALRSTIAFGPIVTVHLATVIVAFAVAPYTKFVHWIFRLLAMQRDDIERRRSG